MAVRWTVLGKGVSRDVHIKYLPAAILLERNMTRSPKVVQFRKYHPAIALDLVKGSLDGFGIDRNLLPSFKLRLHGERFWSLFGEHFGDVPPFCFFGLQFEKHFALRKVAILNVQFLQCLIFVDIQNKHLSIGPSLCSSIKFYN